jgi:6-phosphogluconolactonase (cycloisomerase 2 family)
VRRLFGIIVLAVVAATALAQSSAPLEILYIANGMNRAGKGGSITAFQIDRATGTLKPVIGSPFDSGIIPDSLATDNGSHLFLANPVLDDDNLRVYPIRPETGRLEFEHISTFEGSNYEAERGCCPGPIAVDSNGRFAYIGNATNKTVTVFDVFPASLALTRLSTAYTRPGHFPVQLVWGPNQSILFARTDTGLAQSLLHIYRRDPQKGSLSEATGSPMQIPYLIQAATVPERRQLLALTSSPTSSALLLYSINDDATLTPASAPPIPLDASLKPVALAVHSSGQWISVAARDKSTSVPAIYIYSLASAKPIAATPLPCENSCKITSLTFDATGKFLYVAEASHSQLFGLSYDSDKQSLKPISGSPWNSGDQPHSLLVVEPR